MIEVHINCWEQRMSRYTALEATVVSYEMSACGSPLAASFTSSSRYRDHHC